MSAAERFDESDVVRNARGRAHDSVLTPALEGSTRVRWLRVKGSCYYFH